MKKSSKYTRFAIRDIASLCLAAVVFGIAACSNAGKDEELGNEIVQRSDLADPNVDGLRIEALRQAILSNGFVAATELAPTAEQARSAVGRLIFDSNLMSLNGDISCRDCHLDEFGSADGLPNAVGVGGEGAGLDRLRSGGQILPRNVLPLWGRGGPGFNVFFWDGKVESRGEVVISQYGDQPPSQDPFIVAIHLPSVELDEMVADSAEVYETYVQEDVSGASAIQQELAQRFARDETIGPLLAAAFSTDAANVSFANVADALGSFIRDEFRIRPTSLEQFVYNEGEISRSALNGGILFYGRGRCALCHSGPYFSDFDFHAVAFPQMGFGRNGFGIDEGRFNVTHDPQDRFRFRTPPLYNVSKTAPYSHSGSVQTLEAAIISHFDPLRLIQLDNLDRTGRVDLYRRLGHSAGETLPAELTDQEVYDLTEFLRMLDF